MRQKKGSREKQNLQSQLTGAVCNGDKRAFCCRNPQTEPTIQTPSVTDFNTSPTYLPQEPECGARNLAGFIFGGKNTNPGDYSFAALLGQSIWRQSQRLLPNGKRFPSQEAPKWVCGGSLINYWYVLTAGHCIGSGENQLTYVRLGEHTVEGFGSGEDPNVQDFRITEENIIRHENYRRKFASIENDIALIKLPRKVEMSDYVSAVCLPTPQAAYKAGLSDWDSGINGKNATVVGWGYSCYKKIQEIFAMISLSAPKFSSILKYLFLVSNLVHNLM